MASAVETWEVESAAVAVAAPVAARLGRGAVAQVMAEWAAAGLETAAPLAAGAELEAEATAAEAWAAEAAAVAGLEAHLEAAAEAEVGLRA